MHERFLNRESRDEDVELIRVLKKNVTEKEELLKKLQVYKFILSSDKFFKYI